MTPLRATGRVRKRTFVVAGLSLLAILLAAGMISLFAMLQVGPEDMVTITVKESSSRNAILGSGVSLNTAETANVLQDSSFEPLVFRQILTVYSGDATTLTVSSEDASSGEFGDGFFNDAEARIMSRTDSGLMLKKIARVFNYGINRVGIFAPVNLPANMPSGQAVLAFARNGDNTLAVGENGLIILNAAGQTPEVVETSLEEDLTGVCAAGGGYLACSPSGDLLLSADGRSWQKLAAFNGLQLRAVASASDGRFAAVGEDGALVVGQDNTAASISPLTVSDLTDIVCGDSKFVAVGASGVILTSQNGILWQQTVIDETIDWQAIDYRDGRFVLAGSNGSVAVSDDGAAFTLLAQLPDHDFADVVMLSRRQLILLDSEGGFAISNDSGVTWLNSSIETGMHSRIIALAGKDKILSADSEGSLGLAQLVAEIQMDSALKDGQYQAGDLIFLEKTTLTVPDSYLASGGSYLDPWEHFGSGSSTRVSGDAAPAGGEASLLLMAGDDAGSPAIVSQVIDAGQLADNPNEVWQVELWMKQSDVEDRSVQVWLTGPFKDTGTTFTNVGTTWKKYSFTFVLPSATAGLTDEPIRLNIAVGSGNLWIDQIGLCPASDSTQRLSSDYQSQISAIAPQLIRLGFLNIGSPNSREESWAATPGNENAYLGDDGWISQSAGSLAAALQLTSQSGADPWLVVDSCASSDELLNLLEYLAGPISETYGKLRMSQGLVVPWTEKFNRVVIEFTDSSDVFESDQLKADFVNLMIDAVSQSPYYRQIKGQLIFVDGMTYSEGVVLSTADFHATDLAGIVQADRAMGLQAVFTAYYDLIPRNPEKQTQNWPELMRTAYLGANGVKQPTLAELAEVLVRDLGKQSTFSNLSLPSLDSLEWQQAWPSAATIAAAVARGVPLELSAGSADVHASGFMSDDRIALVLTNLSDAPAACRLLSDLDLAGATAYKFDSKGTLTGQTAIRSDDFRLTVQSGGAVLIIRED